MFIEGALKKIPCLKSYFLSENFEDARLRFKRVTEASSNPIMESVLLFHNTSIQWFTHFDRLLQPKIDILQESMIVSLGRKIVLSNQTILEILQLQVLTA